MKGSITLFFHVMLFWGVFSLGTGLSLIKNEDDIETPKEDELASDNDDDGGDESASLMVELPVHTNDEEVQESATYSEEPKSTSIIDQEVTEDTSSQEENQVEDDESTTENVPASLGTEEDSSAIHQTEVLSPIQEMESTVHGEADQVNNENGYDVPDSGPNSSYIQQEDGGSSGPVGEVSDQDEPGEDTNESVYGSMETDAIPTRSQLDENESLRQDEGATFHDVTSGVSEQDTQETEVNDMQDEVTTISKQTEYPDPGIQHDAGEQDAECASPANQQTFLILIVLSLAVLAI